jgi:hypothetical protein
LYEVGDCDCSGSGVAVFSGDARGAMVPSLAGQTRSGELLENAFQVNLGRSFGSILWCRRNAIVPRDVTDSFPFFLRFPQRSLVLHSLCTREQRFSVAMIRLLKQSIASADVRCLERCQIAAELTFPVVLESELPEGFPGHVTAECRMGGSGMPGTRPPRIVLFQGLSRQLEQSLQVIQRGLRSANR